MISRRQFLLGLAASALYSPAIVRASVLMPVRPLKIASPPAPAFGFGQRLYAHSFMKLITPGLEGNLSLAEVAANLNRRGFTAINGTKRDAAAVEHVVKLDFAIRNAA